MHKSDKGFTLAEVLITLLIIGVIASLVIPGLINNTNEAEFNTGLKKAYSDLSQALTMIETNNDGYISAGTGAGNSYDQELRNDFCSVMACIQTDTSSNIFGPADYTYYKGGNINWPGASNVYPAATLNNSSFIRFGNYGNCNNSGINACAWIHIDINGKKGPNMAGKDLYFFWLTYKDGAYSILPYGTQGDTYSPLPSGCTAGSTSWQTSDGCTAARLINPDSLP